MSNFIQDCINADALLEEIDDYIKKWHESDSNETIYDYLGMTEEEYYLWVEDDFYLKYIISAHEQNKKIEDLISEDYDTKMVARASSPEEAKKIYNWLVQKGKINNEH